MKKQILILLAVLFTLNLSANHFTIGITADPLYDPAITNARVGDTITIPGNNTHPAVQVSAANWAAGIPDTVAGGWGIKTSDYTFTLINTDTIYFMCQNHGPSGMKARVIVQWGIKNTYFSQTPILTIYNISAGFFSFKLTGDQNSAFYTAYLLDLKGRIISKTLFGKGEMVEIDNLKSGVYFLRIIGNKKEETMVKKILISERN